MDISHSGNYIFGAFDNGQVYAYSTLTNDIAWKDKHDERVSCLKISPNGYGLATGCWDFMARLFA